MRDFFMRIVAVWPDVLALGQTHKLVIAFNDRLEAIN